MEYLHNVLAIWGAISLIFSIINTFIPRDYVLNSIAIKRQPSLNFKSLYHVAREVVIDEDGEETLFVAIDCKVKELKIVGLAFVTEGDGYFEEEVIKKYTNILPHEGVAIRSKYPSGIPYLRLKWKLSNGLKGEFTFQENGLDGNTDCLTYLYRPSIFTRVILTISKR